VRTDSARVALLFSVFVAVLLGTFSASLYLWVRDGLERDADDDLQIRSRILLDRIGEELDAAPGGFRPQFVQELRRFLGTTAALADVRSADGTTLFTCPEFARPLEGYRERTESLPAGPAGPLTVRIAASDQPLQARLRQLALCFLVFVPLGIAVSALFAVIVVKRTLAPIEAVRLRAEQISRTSVSDRIPEPPTSGELRDLVRTFNAMLGRLESAIQDLENFAADAAHELRTPLATLRAEIETAIQTTHSPEEHETILASFQLEVARMTHVVTDLFTLAKVEMRQYALQRERVRLAPLLEEARETWQPLASARRIEITTEGGDAEVLGDPVALRRVFMNLVENAVKYNRDGGRVKLSLDRVNGTACVRVSDTGIGIPPDDVPKLFQRFFRVDKARSRGSGGAGLGLAICKSFIASHEGKIGVASTLGEGTTFTVELPAHESVLSVPLR
jgi:heavy metal sensor kinase